MRERYDALECKKNKEDFDLQQRCRGTQGCQKEVSAVPPNLEFMPFLLIFYYIECYKLTFLTLQGCRQIFFMT